MRSSARAEAKKTATATTSSISSGVGTGTAFGRVLASPCHMNLRGRAQRSGFALYQVPFIWWFGLIIGLGI